MSTPPAPEVVTGAREISAASCHSTFLTVPHRVADQLPGAAEQRIVKKAVEPQMAIIATVRRPKIATRTRLMPVPEPPSHAISAMSARATNAGAMYWASMRMARSQSMDRAKPGSGNVTWVPRERFRIACRRALQPAPLGTDGS
jgi:hypothetical protein